MSLVTTPEARSPESAAHRRLTEPAVVRWVLTAITLLFLLLFLALPMGVVFVEAFRNGLGAYANAIKEPDALAALKLTLIAAAVAVPLNMLFGVCASWAIAKFEFRGKQLLTTFIDLPFAVSPVVSGLVFVLLFGRQGFLGPWVAENDIRIIFAVPGIVLATIFVSLPFVVREVVPVLREVGDEQEQAAATLGASGWQSFRRVTLPAIRWGLAYGIVLATARALGEFGAVSVVSGKISGETETLTLLVEKRFQNFDLAGAYAASALLAVLALATLVTMTVINNRREGSE